VLVTALLSLQQEGPLRQALVCLALLVVWPWGSVLLHHGLLCVQTGAACSALGRTCRWLVLAAAVLCSPVCWSQAVRLWVA